MKSRKQDSKQDIYIQKRPNIPLISYKFALQLIPDSGFDSTARLQLATKDEQAQATNDKCNFYDKIQPITQQLHNACTIDYDFVQKLIDDEESSDPMSDDKYVYSHVLMESLEQLFDRYENQYEYSIYDNIKKYILDVSLEDQQISTLTPQQMYLAPQDVRVHCPNICAKASHIQYFAPQQEKTLQISFTPYYVNVSNPNIQQKCYVHHLLHVQSPDLNPNYVFRQPSAHEQWVHIISQGIGLTQLSIQQCFNQIIRQRDTVLTDMINELKFDEAESVVQHLQSNYHVNKKSIGIITSQLIDKIVNKCIEKKPIFFKHKLDPPIRTYEFTNNFDPSIRGIIESKQVTHVFYQFDEDTKIAFLKPIIAQKLLHYHRIGSYSRFINTCLNNEQAVVIKGNKQHNLYDKLSEMNEFFFQCVKKQHQLLLKSMLTSLHASDFIQIDFEDIDYIDIDDTIEKMMLRPLCSCYTCNFWSMDDKTDIADKIFPQIKIHQSTTQQISNYSMYIRKDLSCYSNFTFNAKSFVETVFDIEYSAEFTIIFPFFNTMNKKLNQILQINLIPNQAGCHRPRNVEPQEQNSSANEKYDPKEVLQYVQIFSMLVPTFLQFPSQYGHTSTQYLPIVLSERFRDGQRFDSRLETFLCLINDPEKLVEEKKIHDQTLSHPIRYNHRTVIQSQNQIVGRNLCSDSNINYLEPKFKFPYQYSDFEVASILFTQNELENYLQRSKYKNLQFSSLNDVREVSGAQFHIKHLNSLLIAKKYNGKMPEHSTISNERAIVVQKVTNDRLKNELHDLNLLNTIFNIVYKEDIDKTDESFTQLENNSLCDTQRSFSNLTAQ